MGADASRSTDSLPRRTHDDERHSLYHDLLRGPLNDACKLNFDFILRYLRKIGDSLDAKAEQKSRVYFNILTEKITFTKKL